MLPTEITVNISENKLNEHVQLQRLQNNHQGSENRHKALKSPFLPSDE